MNNTTLYFEFDQKTDQAKLLDPECMIQVRTLKKLELHLQDRNTHYMGHPKGVIERADLLEGLPAGTRIDYHCVENPHAKNKRNKNIVLNVRFPTVASNSLLPVVASSQQVVIAKPILPELPPEEGLLPPEILQKIDSLTPIQRHGLQFVLEEEQPNHVQLFACYVIVKYQEARSNNDSSAAYYENAYEGLSKLVQEKKWELSTLEQQAPHVSFWQKFRKLFTG